jgi:hypothetical protein
LFAIGFVPRSENRGPCTGDFLEANIVTKETQPVPGKRVRITSTKPLIQGGLGNDLIVNLHSRSNLQDPVTIGPAVETTVWDYTPQPVDTRFVRAAITIPAASVWAHCFGVQLRIKETSPR